VVDSNLAVRFLGAAVAAFGYTRRIPPQGASFDSRGQAIYFDGKSYLTRDVDQHGVRNWWKMFNRRGQRIGTFDEKLNRMKDCRCSRSRCWTRTARREVRPRSHHGRRLRGGVRGEPDLLGR
jgi:hypothetical protein